MSFKTLLMILACGALVSCIIVDVQSAEHHDKHNSLNGDLTVPEQGASGDMSTVNGDISVLANGHAGNLSNVNGDIHLAEYARVNDIRNVNGDIHVEDHAAILGNLHTANGDVAIAKAELKGNLKLANGDLSLQGSQIGGSVHIAQVDSKIGENTLIMGDFIVNKTDSHHKPHIVIAANSEIRGYLVLHRPVELSISPDAKVPNIEHKY